MRMSGFTLRIKPALTMYGFEGLGDDPDQHRWRATWAPGDVSHEASGINLSAHAVIKLTPSGAWIDPYSVYQWGKWDLSGGKRWVSNNGGAAWAKQTRDEALTSVAIRLTRWAQKTANSARYIRSAADALEELRPDLARYAASARKALAT